jgi:hypothetical protein
MVGSSEYLFSAGGRFCIHSIEILVLGIKFPIAVSWEEIQTYLLGTFVREATFVSYDVVFFIEWTEFTFASLGRLSRCVNNEY